MNSHLWIEEKYQDFLGLRLKVEDVLFVGKSEFQSVEVVKTTGHGIVLLNDGLIMTTERDEFVYHDMIAHVPLFVHPNPKNVLIIGGGDGGTAREALRHQNVEKVTMVEIDEMVVEASKKHIPLTSSELDNPNLNLIIGDGVKFVKETKEVFDVVLVDSTDPIGPAAPLFGDDFYKDVFSCMSEDGIVVSQGESPFYEQKMQGTLMGVLSRQFPITSIYNFHNLSYPGGLWSFTYASKKYHAINDFDATRVKASNLKFKYYNEATHKGAFALPEFQYQALKGYIKGE